MTYIVSSGALNSTHSLTAHYLQTSTLKKPPWKTNSQTAEPSPRYTGCGKNITPLLFSVFSAISWNFNHIYSLYTHIYSYTRISRIGIYSLLGSMGQSKN